MEECIGVLAVEAPIIIVKESRDLAQVVRAGQESGIIAFDTEANGYYAYQERLCLFQLSAGGRIFLIDVLALAREMPLREMRPLHSLLSSRKVIKVMHGAEADVLGLKRDMGISLRGLFDTMHAARILGEKGLSLEKLVLRHFGERLDKSFQRYNWGRRPISPEALAYAAKDVRYLLPLHELLCSRLDGEGSMARARAAFGKVERMTPRRKVFDLEGYRKLRDFESLSSRSREVLRRIFLVREQIARKLDRAPFRVLNAAAMLRLVHSRPRSRQALAEVRGVPRWLLRDAGGRLLSAIRGPSGQKRPAGRGAGE